MKELYIISRNKIVLIYPKMRGKVISYTDTHITIVTHATKPQKIKYKIGKYCMVISDQEPVPIERTLHRNVRIEGSESNFKYTKGEITFEGIRRTAMNIYIES